MALSHVGTSAWVVGVAAVTPTVPTGTTVGDLVIITLASKYDDATLAAQPTGWTDLGTAINTGRPIGVDTGNTKMRAWSRVWQTGDTMPSLDPTPNNVSVVKASTYRVAAGMTFNVAGVPLEDSTTGTPLAVTTAALPLAVGDMLHHDLVLNGDVVTWGATTVTATGITFGAAVVLTADASTVSGTDLRMRSNARTVTAGTATVAATVSTALAGTVTNAVGTANVLRVREVVAATAFADDFNRADGPLGNNWEVTTDASPFSIGTQQVVGGSALSAARWTTAASSPAMFSQATYRGGAASGVAVAMPAFSGSTFANAGTWYQIQRSPAGAALTIFQKNTGSTTQTVLASSATNILAGDVIRLEFTGTVLTAYINGSAVLSHTPTTPITEQPYVGIVHGTSGQLGTALLDDWTGTGAAAPTSATPVGVEQATALDVAATAGAAQATALDVAAPVAASQPTAYNLGAVVGVSQATATNLAAPIGASQATALDVAAPVTVSRATALDVAAAVGASQPTATDVGGSVGAQQATSLNVAAPVGAQQATAYDVTAAAGATAVGASVTTTVDIAALAAAAQATALNILAAIGAQQTTAYDVLSGIPAAPAIDVAVTIGPTRSRAAASTGPTRQGVTIQLTRRTVTVGDTRSRAQADVTGATRSRAAAATGATRQGVGVGVTRQGVTVGASRQQRGT